MKYKIWDKKSNLVTPTLAVLTPQQVFAKYPASALPDIDFIIVDDKISMGVFMEYSQTIKNYESRGVVFTEEMTQQEKLDAISEFEAKIPEYVPTAEERIASAMEFQNILAMEDMPEEEITK